METLCEEKKIIFVYHCCNVIFIIIIKNCFRKNKRVSREESQTLSGELKRILIMLVYATIRLGGLEGNDTDGFLLFDKRKF